MPKGQTKHWRKRAEQRRRTWDQMLRESNVRERIRRESPEVLRLLDIFAGHTKPFEEGYGWTVFCDWLDEAYTSRYYDGLPVPKGVRLLEAHEVRRVVFPASR